MRVALFVNLERYFRSVSVQFEPPSMAGVRAYRFAGQKVGGWCRMRYRA